MARLKDRYNDEIRPALVSKFGYSTPMQVGTAGHGTLMTLDHVQPRDVDPLVGRFHADDLAGLALVLARDDDHVVVVTDLRHG